MISDSCWVLYLLSAETMLPIIKMLEVERDTVSPALCTASGSFLWTSASLFWTWTWALSALTELLKVRVTLAEPVEELDAM
jgi:hypothetical protein